MEPDDFLSTKYARQMLKDADQMEQDLEHFNKRWSEFWSRNSDVLGQILICHLALEHHVDEWLSAANPGMKPIGETRIPFAQKLELLSGREPALDWILPGIRCLNRIRNQVAHNLEVDLTALDLRPIRDIIWSWQRGAGRAYSRDGAPLIYDFAMFASHLLNSQSTAILRYGGGCGLVSYQRWRDAAIATRADE